jgi:hypothetical protein
MLAPAFVVASAVLWMPALADPGPAGVAAPGVPAPVAPLLRAFQVDVGDFDQFNDLRFDPRTWDAKSAFLAQWQARVDAIDVATLDATGKVDRVVLLLALRNQAAAIDLARRQRDEMANLLPFSDVVLGLEHDRRSLVPIEPQKAAGIVAPLAGRIDALRKELEQQRAGGAAVASAVLARRAAGAVEHLRWVLSEWFAFYDGFDPLAGWWLREPVGDATRALNDYARFLREDVAGLHGQDDDPLIGDPIGRDALLSRSPRRDARDDARGTDRDR